MRLGPMAALLVLGVVGGACGGTLEEDYRNGKVPGHKPTATTARNPGGALGPVGAGTTIAGVHLVPISGSGGSLIR